VTSASAERQIITLTGCLQRGVQPGVYNLMSVATAGVVGEGGTTGEQPKGGETETSAAQLASSSSYQLIASTDEHRQDMAQYENQRVAVRGRLSADVPVGTTGSDQGASAGGKVVDSSATNATVAGSAPPLRGFHVESVRKVGDSCGTE
jgi:hypothetical protein